VRERGGIGERGEFRFIKWLGLRTYPWAIQATDHSVFHARRERERERGRESLMLDVVSWSPVTAERATTNMQVREREERERERGSGVNFMLFETSRSFEKSSKQCSCE
jgi:hypothetical protein